MRLDYNPPKSSFINRSGAPKRLPALILIASMAFSLGFFLYRTAVTQTEARMTPETGQALTASSSPAIQAPKPDAAPAQPEIKRDSAKGVVNPGDTVTALLGKYFTPREIHQISQKSKSVFPLSGICAGQPYELCTVDGSFESFLYEIDRNEQLLIRKNADDFEISRVPIPYTIETEVIRGTITSNLFSAVTEAGEAPELAIALADIFAWDVDFILDIREGDSFKALVEKRYREGKPDGYGRIMAAEFVNRGQSYQAILFKDGDRPADYFDPDGKSLRKAFLKAPLSFTRISSGFTMRRFHPITQTWKAHPAIDYAAPVGTPIKTVGDGTITRAGYTRGNGNFIEVRHTNGYTSLYLHMSKFARGMSKGKRLSQGQVIGYVGSTGLATGPHLCFRMRKDGAPVNPNRIKAPAAPAVSKNNMAAFKSLAAPLLARLGDGAIKQAKLDLPPETGHP